MKLGKTRKAIQQTKRNKSRIFGVSRILDVVEMSLDDP